MNPPPTVLCQIPRRGDIWWVNFPLLECVGSEQRNDRPVVILSVKPIPAMVVSADQVNEALPRIVHVVPLTSPKDRKIDKFTMQFRFLIRETDKIHETGTNGFHGDSIALTEQTRCISTERFLDKQRVARLKTEMIAEIESGVRFVLGIP